MTKTYLVTGGAGFIGSHLVDRLVAYGARVIIVDDFSSGKENNIAQHAHNPKVVLFRRSITSDLSKIFSSGQIDAVVHLAAIPRVQYSIAHPAESHNVNVNGTLNMLILARERGVKRFVNYGSSSEYGDPPLRPFVENMALTPLSPYGLQKLAADHYARLFYMLYGIETITIRPFNVFGPRQDPTGEYAMLIPKAIQWALTGSNFVINGDGEQTRDFTYVDDVVDATVRAVTTANRKAFGESFNVGASDNRSVNEVVDKVIKLCGRKLTPRHGQPKIEPRDTKADISKAREVLEWRPTNTFDVGLKKTFEDYKKRFLHD